MCLENVIEYPDPKATGTRYKIIQKIDGRFVAPYRGMTLKKRGVNIDTSTKRIGTTDYYLSGFHVYDCLDQAEKDFCRLFSGFTGYELWKVRVKNRCAGGISYGSRVSAWREMTFVRMITCA